MTAREPVVPDPRSSQATLQANYDRIALEADHYHHYSEAGRPKPVDTLAAIRGVLAAGEAMLHLDPSPVSGGVEYGDANGTGLVHLGYDATWRRHCRIGAIVDGSPCLVEVRFHDLAPDPFAPDADAEAVRAATRRLMSIIRLHANGFETVLPLLGPSSRIADDWAASLDPDMRAAYRDPVGLTLYLAAPGVSARAEGRGDDDALAEALADRWPDVGTHVEIHHDRFGGSEDIVIGQVARWLQDEPIDVVEAMRAAARIANGARRPPPA